MTKPLILPALVLAMAGTVSAGYRRALVVPAVCAAADDHSAQMVVRIKNLLNRADSAAVATRASFQWSKTASASSVAYVTNNATCASVEAVYTPAVQGNPPIPPSGTVYVYQIGTDFWVYDTAQVRGRSLMTATVDKRFKLVGTSGF